MENTIDKIHLREDKVESVVFSHLKEKYNRMIVKVECKTSSFNFKGITEFHFFIDVDYGRQDGPDSFYNRMIKKEVYNLCKYILGEGESFNGVVFNSSILAIPTP